MALEARALEKLDGITPHRADLVIPKPSKAAAILGDPIALILNMKFS